MKLYLVHNGNLDGNKIEILNSLQNIDIEALHLRECNIDEIINSFKMGLNSRKIHVHINELEYNLNCSVHLKSNLLKSLSKIDLHDYINEIHKKGFDVSASVHTIDEIIQYNTILDYLFISPIFDSISKIGYKSNLDFNELKECLTKIKNNNIIALGGVKMDNILKLKNIGFESFALLGSIWNNGNPLENTKSILDFITSQQFDI